MDQAPTALRPIAERTGVRPVPPSGLFPARHRRGALDDVRRELATGRGDTEPAVAIRGYGTGRLVLGLAGPVDRAMAIRFRALLRLVHRLSDRELVLTFGRLTSWDRALPAAISSARLGHITEGGQVELTDVPDALLIDLDLGAPSRAPAATPPSTVDVAVHP